jgi:hypothetical protein
MRKIISAEIDKDFYLSWNDDIKMKFWFIRKEEWDDLFKQIEDHMARLDYAPDVICTAPYEIRLRPSAVGDMVSVVFDDGTKLTSDLCFF